jgi:pimeloyl-ACP methyl ester carboxylesterase
MIANWVIGTLGVVAAPVKHLALIKNAGHFAAFSQPDQFLAELLTRVRPLAAGGQLRPI